MNDAPPTAALNARHAGSLVSALVASGLERAVLSPGSRNTPLVLAFREALGARAVVVVDERSAGFVALGMARGGGAPVALVCTSGSAGANYAPAVVEAGASRLPLVVLTADRPPELHDCGAGQTMDQQHLFGRHMRFFQDLGAPAVGVDPAWLRRVATRAVDRTRGPLAGPVHLNVPFREPLWSPTAPASDAPSPPPADILRGRPSLSAEQLDTVAAALRAARRGAIVCGPVTGVPEPHAVDAIRRLAAALDWPLIADPVSGLRFGRAEGAHVIATADALLRDPDFAEAHAPDCVLRFGAAPTSKPTFQWLGRHAADTAILVDLEGAWHDPTGAARMVVAADVAGLCDALLPRIAGGQPEEGWTDRWVHADARARAHLDAACAEGPPWEGAIARRVVDALPAGALLHVASSMPIRDLDGFAPALEKPLEVTANRGVNGIDGTLSTAVGEAIATARPTCVLCGDLAALHDVGGLHTAVALGARLTVVVVDNGGGGIFGFLPIADHPTSFESGFVTPQHTDATLYAEAAGARGRTVECGALTAAVAEAVERPGVDVLRVVVDRETNLARHRETWAAIAEAIR